MKKLWFPMAALALLLAGCSSDHTLETLIPRNSMAVLLVDQPAMVAQALGSGVADLPWKALDGNKPWGAAVLPAEPPGFLLAVALGDQSSAWATVQAWARERGGLEAVRFGTYAVLTSPGLPAPAILDTERRFDLARVRSGGDPVAVYVDVKNVIASAPLPPALRSAFPILPWVEKNLDGLRLGFSARDGGLEARLATDWKPGTTPALALKTVGSPADLSHWTGSLPASGLGMAASLPPFVLDAIGPLFRDPALARRWASLAPLIGPRLAVSVSPRDGSWVWAAAIEARDPQAVRQALKTLVAGGDLQRHFADWALDADTPLIYQDKPDGFGGVRTQLTLGSAVVQLGYGADRVAVVGGPGAVEALGIWKKPAVASASWFREAPVEASLVASCAVDGLGARGAVKILADGNVEVRVWVDAAGLRIWEERLPQAARTWLSGPGGWTRTEP
jgi:hypothetical protein